jgi:hypothetical protein
MNKELVEIRQGADPSDSEEPGRRAGSDLRDEPREVLALSHFRPSPLSESLEGTRQDEARTSKEVVFSQHEMGGEVVTSPALDQGKRKSRVISPWSLISGSTTSAATVTPWCPTAILG